MRLVITPDRRDELPIWLRPELRRTLVDLMAAAIIAVHRPRSGDVSEEGSDDDAGE